MASGETHGLGVLCQVIQQHALAAAQHFADQPFADGVVVDAGDLLLRHAHGDEALQRSRAVGDAQRRIAGTRKFERRLGDPIQHAVQRQVRVQAERRPVQGAHR